MRLLFLIAGLLLSISIQAQKAMEFRFVAQLNDKEIHPNDSVNYIISNQSIRIYNLKLYISNFHLSNEGNVVYSWSKHHHLIDLQNESSTHLILEEIEGIDFDRVHFLLGVDSTSNTSGALSGDLDPRKGMYWTWQSGYINVKLEGWSSLSQARDKRFEYHLGGYLPPFETVQEVSLAYSKKTPLVIVMHLNEFFELANIGSKARVMSPGEEAKRMSKEFAKCFQRNEQ